MVNPVSSAHQTHTHQTSQVTPQQQRSQPKPQSTEVQDKVTLNKSGDVDHDGDSR